MRTNNTAKTRAAEKLPEGDLTCLETIACSTGFQPTKIGTISFPVRGVQPLSDNTNLIGDIIRKRQPALLLCAGWSVPSQQSVDTLVRATKGTKTQVVLESTSPNICYRVCRGRKIRMGKQVFFLREDTNNAEASHASKLADALRDRSFRFSRRKALLLVCGEVMVVTGRNQVVFHPSVPQKLQDAVCAPTAMILNPTHTRMKNDGSVQAWREFLSSGRRVYVSASNWDLSSRQGRSTTLHSLWHNGKSKTPLYSFENDKLCYREWLLPGFGKR